MTKKPIKSILLVEDDTGDARLLREMLVDASLNTLQMTHVESLGKAETFLAKHSVDMVLLDLGLPDASGLEVVRRTCFAAPCTPVVVMTGLDDESLADDALEEGAQDYLIKGQIAPRALEQALRYAVKRKVIEDAMVVEKGQIAHAAQHDVLTGLPNRMLLNDRISQAIALAPRHKKKVVVFCLDLDRFKRINDSFGHSTGDKLLQSVAKRLLDCVRGSDTVSRTGGDEFVVLLSEVQRTIDASITARRMLDAVAEIHSIDQHDLHVTSSIGISIYPHDGFAAETLIKNADAAMGRAKKDGGKAFQFFAPAASEAATDRRYSHTG
jgi:diguanylate cyclase (GGDEF)-like protein